MDHTSIAVEEHNLSDQLSQVQLQNDHGERTCYQAESSANSSSDHPSSCFDSDCTSLNCCQGNRSYETDSNESNASQAYIDMLVQMLNSSELKNEGIVYRQYESERQMPDIKNLMQGELSEPYSIYTYRYFISNWPELCYLAYDSDDKMIGAIIGKLDDVKKHKCGYIAMLAVNSDYRRKRIGCNLVLRSILEMLKLHVKKVILETEITNKPALKLYENLGFIRAKRMFRYYLNGCDAFRLKLHLT